MGTEKRQRQRDNRARGIELRDQIKKTERRKRSTRWLLFIGAPLVIAIVVLGAWLASRGGDDNDVNAGASGATGATGASGATGDTQTTVAGPTTTIDITTITAAPTGDAAVDAITCTGDRPPAPSGEQFDAAPPMTIDPTRHYTATIKTSCGDIVVDLDATKAPNTVNNFVFLAKKGFYNGVTFHRVVPDFVIQAGDPTGSGSGGPGYQFADENITQPYERGSLAMANSGKNTNGSQFFVLTGTKPNGGLTQSYNNFGKVTSGLEVARKIEAFANLSVNNGDGPPSRSLFIISVTVDEPK